MIKEIVKFSKKLKGNDIFELIKETSTNEKIEQIFLVELNYNDFDFTNFEIKKINKNTVNETFNKLIDIYEEYTRSFAEYYNRIKAKSIRVEHHPKVNNNKEFLQFALATGVGSRGSQGFGWWK